MITNRMEDETGKDLCRRSNIQVNNNQVLVRGGETIREQLLVRER